MIKGKVVRLGSFDIEGENIIGIVVEIDKKKLCEYAENLYDEMVEIKKVEE